VNNVEIEDLR